LLKSVSRSNELLSASECGMKETIGFVVVPSRVGRRKLNDICPRFCNIWHIGGVEVRCLLFETQGRVRTIYPPRQIERIANGSQD
jgi:hypothetical protein